MNIQISYPAQIKTKEVRSILILLEKNLAIVELWDTERDRIEVDLTSIMKEFDEVVIKAFLIKIISIASGVEEKNIPDKIFKKEIVEK